MHDMIWVRSNYGKKNKKTIKISMVIIIIIIMTSSEKGDATFRSNNLLCIFDQSKIITR
jgi:hypothetical protein